MAIIKCPECGRQISDKAPACPNCGVPIAGKIVRCPQCGEIYFKDQEMCPNCHHLTPRGETLVKGEVGNTSLNHNNAPQSQNIADAGKMEGEHAEQRPFGIFAASKNRQQLSKNSRQKFSTPCTSDTFGQSSEARS